MNVLVSGKSEVCNFEVDLVVHQDIFKFQVSVHYSLVLNVFHDLNKLFEIESSSVLSHTPEGLAKVKEKSPLNIFEHDKNKVIDFSPWRFKHMTLGSIANNIDNILVIDALKDLDFLLNSFDWALISL